MEKIDLINLEETAYGWELSQYPVRKQAHDRLMPYKKLFDAGQEFVDKHNIWMHSQVGTHDPDIIKNDVETIYRIMLKLEKSFADRPTTHKLAGNVSFF